MGGELYDVINDNKLLVRRQIAMFDVTIHRIMEALLYSIKHFYEIIASEAAAAAANLQT